MDGLVVAGIQARMSSSRFPGKVMEDLGGRPMIEQIYRRVKSCQMVDEVYVLTSTDPSDDILCEFLFERFIPYRRGSLGDVLSRYLELADERNPAYVVRVTGDCPFVDPDFISAQLVGLIGYGADIIRADSWGDSFGGQTAMSVEALRACADSEDPRDREHVGAFFLRGNKTLHTIDMLAEHPRYVRLQVDEPEDLEFARKVWDAVSEGKSTFPTDKALDWIDKHPAVTKINRHIRESKDNQDLRAMK